MTRETFELLDGYMLSQMDDAAHDREHIYRVLYNALDIASFEEGVDMDVLIAACLLHDVGRRERGFSEDFACAVRDAIRTHRFRANDPPVSVEARILFDADKLDAVGTMGIARTLSYKGQVGDALYVLGPDGIPSDGEGDGKNTFFNEYKIKLSLLYEHFYTRRGRELAGQRRRAAEEFYLALLRESREPYERGRALLEGALNDE